MTVTIADPHRPATLVPLLPVLQRLLPGAVGRAALRIPPEGRLSGAAEARLGRLAQRRRMARTLLQDVAETTGGQVFETQDGSLLLFGSLPRPTARVAEVVSRMAGLPPPAAWTLPRDAGALLAWAQGAALAPMPAAAAQLGATPGLAGLDARLEALAPEKLLRSRPLRRALRGSGGAVQLAIAGLRLRLCRRGLATEFGTLAADADLLRHAEDRLAARLLASLAAWALDFPGLWMLPLPRGGLAGLLRGVAAPAPPLPQPWTPEPGFAQSDDHRRPWGTIISRAPAPLLEAPPGPLPGLPKGRPGLVGVLPFAAMADAGFAATRLALAEHGWGLALEGPPLAALPLLDLGALPADQLLLRWSPALADRGAAAALRRADPARLVLTAAEGAEALEFAARLGIAAVSGPAVDRAE